MSLRNSLRVQIWAAIEKSPFTVADFDVKFDEDDELLRIVFRYDKNYFLAITEDYKRQLYSQESPGEHRKLERYALSDHGEIPTRIGAWSKNVRDELRSTIPVYGDLDELKETLEAFIKGNVKDPDSTFTPSEADILRQKLDELSARFEEMQQRNQLTEQELNKLNQEIASIKVNLSSYPKGTWYKTAANKLWTTANKIVTSKESRQLLADAAKKMLGLSE